MSKTKQKLDQNAIHRVLKLIRPYAGMVILTLTFALITVVTTLLAPVLSGKAVDMILVRLSSWRFCRSNIWTLTAPAMLSAALPPTWSSSATVC